VIFSGLILMTEQAGVFLPEALATLLDKIFQTNLFRKMDSKLSPERIN
jgi:hypothetical protein